MPFVPLKIVHICTELVFKQCLLLTWFKLLGPLTVRNNILRHMEASLMVKQTRALVYFRIVLGQ